VLAIVENDQKMSFLKRPPKPAPDRRNGPQGRAPKQASQAPSGIHDRGEIDEADTLPIGRGQTFEGGNGEQALADYIARKYQPERRRRDIEDIDCADVLSIYLSDVGEPSDQFEIEARIDRLNEFWGGKAAGL